MEYTTLERLKSFLTITDDSQDAELSELITQATALVDIELGDNMGTQTITRRVDGNGCERIIMENRINSVEYVKEKPSDNEIAVDFVQGSSVYLDRATERGRKNIEIRYEKGYDDVPPDLERFFWHYCKELIAMAEETGTEVVKSQSLGGGLSLTYFSPSELSGRLANFDGVLAKYRNFSI